MTFISYAQNAEDVILWRALKHIENGFYIDVGANDPEDDSVTKAFYDRGWHGINIEPLPHHHACLQKQRPRDINLQMAAGDHDGELTLYDVPSVRGWATPDPDVAEHYRQQDLEVISCTVPVRRLDSLCAELGVTDIHFLKIDVEGFEAQVIQGMNFQQWRPWILIIEATQPNTQESRHQHWEPMLLNNQYQYAYSDGLNRYYVAQEHLALVAALALQPNVFDNYRFIGYQRAEQALLSTQQQLESIQIELEHSRQQQQQQQAQLHELQNQLHKSRQHLLNLHSQLVAVTNQLDAVTSSLSWRITKPLRELNHRLAQTRLAFRQPNADTRDTLKQTLKITFISGLKKRINSLRYLSRQSALPKERSQSKLSPRTALIYYDLQKTIEARKN